MSTKDTKAHVGLVRELADILNETDLNEIEYKTDALRLTLRRGGTEIVQTVAAAPQVHAAAPPAPAPATAGPSAPTATEPDTSNAVTSPMVGTAYVRPSPDADTFARVGDSVKEGDTILLVEAMKTFNPITAPRSGRLAAVHVEDAQGVEFGDPLFSID